MRVYILIDNIVNKRGLLAEHGLSLFIEYGEYRILFDTGQSGAYLHNAAKMNVNLEKIDFIALSHGHYDHCGGLAHFPHAIPPVYIHPGALVRRFSRNADGKHADVGIPWTAEDRPGILRSLVLNEKEAIPRPGVHLFSSIPAAGDSSAHNGILFREESGEIVPDPFTDEQILVIESDEGLAVFLGCAHPGVTACAEHVLERFPNREITVLMGGMHMGGLNPRQLEETAARLTQYPIRTIIPLHCTGMRATSELKRVLAGRCQVLTTGDVWERE